MVFKKRSYTVLRFAAAAFWCVLLCESAYVAYASEAVQFYLGLDEQAFCGRKVEGRALALDAYGVKVKEYQGQKKASWSVRPAHDNAAKTFAIGPEIVEFKDGQAVFYIQDSLPETVEVSLKIDAAASTLPARITFSQERVAPAIKPVDREGGDSQPPYITEIVMHVQSIIEVTFNEELDDVAATDASNYEVLCDGTRRPVRNVELHGRKVILQTSDPMPERKMMYIELRNIKDQAGNEVVSGNRSSAYEVPCCGAGFSHGA